MTSPSVGALAPREFLRWIWRQLTSMRTALFLLLLLALGSVPGSVIPQTAINDRAVAEFRAENPDLGKIYDALGLFSVYNSAWYSAIYLLLMISLVGCILPRCRTYAKALRAAPPSAPKNLQRMPQAVRFETSASVEEVLAQARGGLSKRRFRVRSASAGDDAVSAERGYLREAGNLLFHISVVVVLVAFGYGNLYGYKGAVIIPVGQGFTNVLSQYDKFTKGSLFDPADLAPLSFNVDQHRVEYRTSGNALGSVAEYRTRITYTEDVDDAPKTYTLRVNHPLVVDGVSVFLVSDGYAPIFRVTDGEGNVAYEAATPFVPEQLNVMTSFGVIKAPEAKPDQLGFQGQFFPTYNFDNEVGPFSQFPDALRPRVSLLAYRGDLGLDDGVPQNVYELDLSRMEKFSRPGAQPDDPRGTDLRINLAPGEKLELPDGAGSIEFVAVERYVQLQVSHSPGKGIALGGVVAAVLGLMASLFIRSRRVWVRAVRRNGVTVVEVAGLDRNQAGDGLADEVAKLAAELEGATSGVGAGETAKEN